MIFALLAGCTVAVIAYAGEIFETYPTCEEDAPCPYVVPVFVGETLPPVTWSEDWNEPAVFANPADMDTQDLFTAGRSGALVDPMMASGFMAALIALWISWPMDRQFRRMIFQLRHDQVIPAGLLNVTETEQARRRWAWSTAIIVTLVMFFGVLGFFDGAAGTSERRAFLIGSTLLGAIAGHRLGSAAAYGRYSHSFRKLSHEVRLLPGHADGMGGYRRLSEFIAYQVVLLLVPVIWLSTWLYIEYKALSPIWICSRPGAHAGMEFKDVPDAELRRELGCFINPMPGGLSRIFCC